MHSLDPMPRYTEDGEYIFTIEELNQAAASALSSQFKLIFVSGEVSNLSRPASGHLYFSLKDAHAQIRCAWFRGHQSPFAFQLENGVSIIVLAEVTIYQDRGDYQLVIKKIFLSGAGLIQQQLDALKRKLQAEGLFDPQHKKPLPSFPQTVGVISSKTGAALQDVLAVFKRRAPFIHIIVYPCLVQGETAAQTMIQALSQAEQQGICDALILTRGGGSNEDLWAFNDVNLAYAIFNAKIPIVSAVGHEIDLCISDYVADQRASTPTAAAELLSPDQFLLQETCAQSLQRLHQSIKRLLEHKMQSLDQTSRLLKHPTQKLQEQKQNLIVMQQRLHHHLRLLITEQKARYTQLQHAFNTTGLQTQWTAAQHTLRFLNQQLQSQIQARIKSERQQWLGLVEKLETLNPLSILKRGYSIVYSAEDQVISDTIQVKLGEMLSIQLHSGRLECIVKTITPTAKS